MLGIFSNDFLSISPLEAKAEFGLPSLRLCELQTLPSLLLIPLHHLCQGLEAGCSHMMIVPPRAERR